MEKPVCWVLTGPTASGKTAISLRLAEQYGCEIVCMDSMQIYRKMDIGTAKPTAWEQKIAPHWMLDIVDPTQGYTVAQYVEDAEKAAREILSRGKKPLFVGGTGLYLHALRHPLALGDAPADPALRARLEAQGETSEGRIALHQALQQVDPVTAARLHVNDVRRVVRALEVTHATGVCFSQHQSKQTEVPFSYRIATLDMERSILYQRIHQRVDQMIEQGLETEVQRLLQQGVSPQSQAMKAIGYKEWLPYFQDGCTVQQVIETIKLDTRHYAKRQLTWMRREEDVLWVDALAQDAYQTIENWFIQGDDQFEH